MLAISHQASRLFRNVLGVLLIAVAALLAACGGGEVLSGSAAVVVAADIQEKPLSVFTPQVPSVPAGLTVSYSIKRFHFKWGGVSGATHYEFREDADGETLPLGYSQVGGSIAETRFVHDLPALHMRLNARYVVRACNAAGCSADTAPLVPDLAQSIGYFKSMNTNSQDNFGVALALSADGNTLAVGANFEASNATGVNGDRTDNSMLVSGAVYVYVRDAGVWKEQAYLKASNTGEDDMFGMSVALSADGNTLAVGAPFEDSSATGINGDGAVNLVWDSGAVYVFSRAAGVWAQQAYVKASNTGLGDEFGSAVALSSNGDTLAVGAPYEASNALGINGDQSDNTFQGIGAAYVFHRVGTGWSQQAYVKASNLSPSEFGHALALSGDGVTLAVGAWKETSAAMGINGAQGGNGAALSGAVYVFVADAAGGWSQQAYVKASNTAVGDLFGAAVALSSDGNTMAVGAPLEDSKVGIDGDQMNNDASNAGAVYLFIRTAGIWAQQAYIKASNPDPEDQLGHSVALSADGNYLAAGAAREDGSAMGMNGDQSTNSLGGSGAVYFFSRAASGTWTQQAYVKAPNPALNDNFGAALALSADGHSLAVGAALEDGNGMGLIGNPASNAALNAGAIYLY